MDFDPATFPAIGRVGRGRAGELKDCWIFVHLATADRDPEYAFWQAFAKPGPTEELEEVGFVDHKSETLQRYLLPMQVDWIPAEADALVEDEELGLRRFFASSGSPAYADHIERLDAQVS